MNPQREISVMEAIENLCVAADLVNYKLKHDGQYTPERALKRLSKPIGNILAAYIESGLEEHLAPADAGKQRG